MDFDFWIGKFKKKGSLSASVMFLCLLWYFLLLDIIRDAKVYYSGFTSGLDIDWYNFSMIAISDVCILIGMVVLRGVIISQYRKDNMIK